MGTRQYVKLQTDEHMLGVVKSLGREVTCTEAAALAGVCWQRAGPSLKRLVRRGQLLVRQAEKTDTRSRVIPVLYYRWAGELSPDVPSWFPHKAVVAVGARRVQGRDA